MQSETHTLPRFLHKPLPASRSALLATFKKASIARTHRHLQSNRPMTRLLEFDNEALRPLFYKSIRSTRKARASLLIQMRLGHTQLNAHLFKMNLSETQYCEHCPESEEMLIHYLIHCPRYVREREELRRRIGERRVDIRYRYLLKDKDGWKELLRFVKETKRFKPFVPTICGLFDT
jgi:hypothetical protein